VFGVRKWVGGMATVAAPKGYSQAAVVDRFVNTKTPTASTLVQVAKLYRDDVLIEVEATAIIRSRGM